MNGPPLKGKGFSGGWVTRPLASLGLELRPDTGSFVQTDSCCVPVGVLIGPQRSWHEHPWRGLQHRKHRNTR